MRRLAAVLPLVIGLVVLLGAAGAHVEPLVRGSDEIDYTHLSPRSLQPGESVTQPIGPQAPGLSRVEFLYSLDAASPAPVHAVVAAGDRVIVDTDLLLTPTPHPRDAQGWFAPLAVGGTVRLEDIAVPAPAANTVRFTLSVPAGGHAIVLWWNPWLGAHAYRDGGPLPSLERPGEHLAVQTEYGPIEGSLAKAPTFADRIAHYGAPWLPAPVLWLLGGALLALVGAVMWLVAVESGDE